MFGFSIGVCAFVLAHPWVLLPLLALVLTPITLWAVGYVIKRDKQEQFRRRVVEAKLKQERYEAGLNHANPSKRSKR